MPQAARLLASALFLVTAAPRDTGMGLLIRAAPLPKSQVEFLDQHQALIPVWLAREFGYTINTDSMLYD
jgi:hypothetical protein